MVSTERRQCDEYDDLESEAYANDKGMEWHALMDVTHTHHLEESVSLEPEVIMPWVWVDGCRPLLSITEDIEV